MSKTKTMIVTSVVAGVTALTIATTAIMPSMTTRAAAEYVVDFNDGNYSVWDGTSYTFDWYDNPTIEDGITVYTISQASDLAGLCVLTNNLSASEFSGITNNIAAEDAGYIASVDTFEDKIIKLGCDIDLSDFDWMPISYPWATANLTARYEFTNTEGNTVKYNAVSEIPDDTVDPWVGDENGDPISTRYWEYPESELRFRDLTQNITGSGSHALYADEMKKRLTPFIAYSSAMNEHYNLQSIDLPVIGVTHQNFNETDIMVNYTFKSIKGFTETPGFEGTFDGGEYKIKGLCPSTPWTDDTTERLTTYDPIAKGLFGMLGEKGTLKNISVKGSYDDEVVSYSAILCAWNYGTINHCYVDGYMNQSLVEMIYPVNRDYGPNGTSTYVLSDTAGTVMPVGNSGFLTSQNYGTIIDSYTVGEVVQAFRQFGFAASSNYGTIINCENRASFSTQPVETDFITDEWDFKLTENQYYAVSDTFALGNAVGNFDGVSTLSGLGVSNIIIEKGVLRGAYYLGGIVVARNSWTPSQRDILLLDNPYTDLASTKECATWDNIVKNDSLTNFTNNIILSAPLSEYAIGDCWQLVDDVNGTYAYIQSVHHATDSAAGLNTTCLHPSAHWGTDNAHYQLANSYTSDMWIPEQYNTAIGESVAANHLYGVYQQTVVGGIAAVNYGTVTDCLNAGNIEAMYNTSPRNNFDTDNTLSETYSPTRHSYSYIRPSNSYSMFATATNTHTVAAGLVGINMGSVSGINTGSIDKRAMTVQEQFSSFTDKRNDMILATQNGFYQNGVKFDGDVAHDFAHQWRASAVNPIFAVNGNYYTNWGLGWFITEDNLNEYLLDCSCDSEDCTYAYTADLFDRNMPYPFVIRESCKLYQSTAGICAVNCNKILNTEHTGYADFGICKLSIGTVEDSCIDTATVNIEITEDAPVSGIVFGIAKDTDIRHARSTVLADAENESIDIPTATGNKLEGDTRRVCAEDIIVYKGIGSINVASNATVTDVIIYDTDNEGKGVCASGHNVSMNNIYNYQDSFAACGSLSGEYDLTDIYSFGDNLFAFVDGDINGSWSNLLYYGPHCTYLFNSSKSSVAQTAEINGVYAYPLTDTLGVTDEGIITKGINIKNVELFIDCDIHMWDAYNCNISHVNLYGDTAHIDASSENVIKFDNCTVEDFLSQINVDIEVKNYRDTFQLQNLPGVLKAQRDTNTFVNVAIMTPAGLASYPTLNSADDIDTSILTDASLVNDENARVSGALAYYMDKGTRLDRTYYWTVSNDKTVNVLPDECIVDVTLLPDIPSSITLPEHTCKLDSEDRSQSFYRFNIPNSAAGFGEITGTSTRGDLTQKTSLEGLYEQTSLFLHEGEEISLAVTTDNTHALIGMTKATLQKTEEIPSDDKPASPYKHTREVMPAYDVELIGVWSGVHSIEVDPDIMTWISLEPNVYGAATNQVIELTGFMQDPSSVLTDIYYYEYKLDSNNKFTLDRSSKHSIDMTTLSFTMPDANIQISASRISDSAEITRFVLAGVEGNIIDNTITIELNSSVDISNIAPDVIDVSEGAVVAPDATSAQNFLEEVRYVVTAPSGKTTTYFVKVTPLVDGEITRFNVLGFDAEITEDNEIRLTVPEDLDVTNVTPLIVWSGISIDPDLSTPLDLTAEDLTFKVENSQNVVTTYTFTLIREEHINKFTNLTLAVDNVNLEISIDYENKIISVVYPFGLDVSAVKLEGVGIIESEDILVDSTINLTKHNNIILRASDGSTSMYEVIATEQKDPRKEITQFTLFGYNGVINNEDHTIVVELPEKYDITDIAPDVVGYLGKEITDISVKKNFTQNVEYTVVAYDDSSVTYTVIVLRIS